MTALSLLSALVAVLTCLGNFVRVGPFPVTLTLCPIIIGAALYGPGAGAFLGGVFGLVVFITGILGWDGGAVMVLMTARPVILVILCFLKAIAAGFLAGIVYKGIAYKSPLGGSIAAGIICPVVNTGIFIAFMLAFYREVLSQWAGGKDILTYAVTGLAGVNFLVELMINMALATAVTSIIAYAKRRQ